MEQASENIEILDSGGKGSDELTVIAEVTYEAEEVQVAEEIHLVHQKTPNETCTPPSTPGKTALGSSPAGVASSPVASPARQILIVPHSRAVTNGNNGIGNQIVLILPPTAVTPTKLATPKADHPQSSGGSKKVISIDDYRRMVIGKRLVEENAKKSTDTSSVPTEKKLLHLCGYCGFKSEGSPCQRCKRVITNGKLVEPNQTSVERPVQSTRKTYQRGVRARNEEPQCVTLSSDEEELAGEPEQKKSREDDINEKEETIYSKYKNSYLTLDCRLVQVGETDINPVSAVILAADGIFIKTEADEAGQKSCVRIKPSDISKIEAALETDEQQRCLIVSFCSSVGFLSMSTKADVVRLFPADPKSLPVLVNDLKQRETYRQFISDSSPKVTEVQQENTSQEVAQIRITRRVTRSSKSHSAVPAAPRLPVERMFTWLDEFSVTTEDYLCLNEEQFLNDSIIDFYLKFIYRTKLSEGQQNKYHIFSSFFYQRLTSRPPKQPGRPHPIEDNTNLSAAEKRHHRVKSWTKKVDLFSKDFVVVPINEHSHWYLAIICFPGLSGPVRAKDNVPVTLPPLVKRPVDKKKKTEALLSSILAAPEKTITYGSTTITVVLANPANQPATNPSAGTTNVGGNGNPPPVPLLLTNGKSSNRDEAESESDDEEPVPAEEAASEDIGLVKQPCILILDSLIGASHTRVASTLRDYLRIEYVTKQKGDAATAARIFSKDVVQGYHLKVPQQTNSSDCGVYVLQYVETFFQKPIEDYRFPLPSMREWFPVEVVQQKRRDIQQLLLNLMEENNPNHSSIAQLLAQHAVSSKPIPDEAPDGSTVVLETSAEKQGSKENVEPSAPNVIVVPMVREEEAGQIVETKCPTRVDVADINCNASEIHIDP